MYQNVRVDLFNLLLCLHILFPLSPCSPSPSPPLYLYLPSPSISLPPSPLHIISSLIICYIHSICRTVPRIPRNTGFNEKQLGILQITAGAFLNFSFSHLLRVLVILSLNFELYHRKSVTIYVHVLYIIKKCSYVSSAHSPPLPKFSLTQIKNNTKIFLPFRPSPLSLTIPS